MGLSKLSIIVIIGIVVLACAVPWFIFLSKPRINDHLFLIMVATFALLPLYPLYRFVKRWPRFTSGILSLAISVFLTVIAAFLAYLFHIDSGWVQDIYNLSQLLFVISSLLLVWQAVRRRHS